MREIKFRAYNKTEKHKWMTVKSLWINEKGDMAHISGDTETEFTTWHYDFELMQYTGLKDKNGKEIYEGDILKWWDTKISENKFTYQVIFNTGRFVLKGVLFDVRDMEAGTKYVTTEIIGNIYENPELLES